MHVKELISLLQAAPPDAEVRIAYDTFAVVSNLDNEKGSDSGVALVYSEGETTVVLCAQSSSLAWYLSELEEDCHNPLNGHRLGKKE